MMETRVGIYITVSFVVCLFLYFSVYACCNPLLEVCMLIDTTDIIWSFFLT